MHFKSLQVPVFDNKILINIHICDKNNYNNDNNISKIQHFFPEKPKSNRIKNN